MESKDPRNKSIRTANREFHRSFDINYISPLFKDYKSGFINLNYPCSGPVQVFNQCNNLKERSCAKRKVTFLFQELDPVESLFVCV